MKPKSFVTFVLLSSLLSFSLSKETDEPEEAKEEKEKKHPKLVEYGRQASMRPTKCQVCRVLAQELWIEVNNTKNVKRNIYLSNRLDGDETKNGMKFDYKTSELRLMDILETLCKKVYDYRSIAGPDFPYLKGVKSMFRQQLEDVMGTSGLKLTLDAPKEIVEDPTLELRRMHYHCNQMIEEYEDDVIEWYLHKQQSDPIEYLCAERIVDNKKQDCLTASTDIPDFAKGAKNGKLNFKRDQKAEL